MTFTRQYRPLLPHTHTQFCVLAVDKLLALLKNDMLPQPSADDYACMLHRCRKEKNRLHAFGLHTLLHGYGLETHTALGHYLVVLLVDVGIMHAAQQLFDKLLIQHNGSWHSLLIGYVRIGKLHHALTLFCRMQLNEFVSLPGPVAVALLKACAALKDLVLGNEIHTEIARAGLLDTDLFVGTTLVDMYAKCGMLAKAHEVFEKLSVRNVVTWNTLMVAYANHGYGQEILNCLDRMHLEGVFPDPVTFVCSLKACARIQATSKGQEIHNEIERQGLLERDHVVGCALIDMYAKDGSLAIAQEVFDKLPVRDAVAWTVLLAGYTEQGCAEEVLKCLKQMQLEGVDSDDAAMACMLQACGAVRAVEMGRQLHAEIQSLGLLHNNLIVGNALIDMYAKFELLPAAQDVFDKLLIRDVVSWNSLISGYIGYEHGEKVLEIFEQMQLEKVAPTIVTYVCSLNACACLKALERGQEIHVEIQKTGLDRDLLVGNALIDMYAKCGLIVKAQEVFNKLSLRTEVTWTAMIAGYAEHGYGNEALMCFEQMLQEGVHPDVATFVCILKACGMVGARNKGEEMHAEIQEKQWLERDLAVGSRLIDMYVKCGLLPKGHELFDNLPVRNACLWTTLIAGYAEQGQGEEALKCLEQMSAEGISPDNVAYICSLKACGSVGATKKARELHAEVVRSGVIERDPVVGSAVVDMYAKCGSITLAQQVFDKLLVQDVSAWNSLILGHTRIGDCDSVFRFFHRMLQKGMVPDSVTFMNVLSACKHVGLSHESLKYLNIMSKKFGVTPTSDHQACMVDVLCRMGHLGQALTMIRRMPHCLDLVIWHTMLDACRSLGNIELGKEAFRYAVRADREHAAAYIMMSHINAGAVT